MHSSALLKATEGKAARLPPASDGPTEGKPPTWSLFWRVFAVNAVVLVGDGLLLALAPPLVSSPPVLADALVIIAGLATMLLLTYFLMRRAFLPLQRLRERAVRVDALRSGERLPDDGRVREASELTGAFNEMLHRLEAERRASALRTMAAREEQRRRLSRELHDEVGQNLSAVLLLLQSIGEHCDKRDAGRVLEAREMVRDGLDSARRVARELRPEVLDRLGVLRALTELVLRMSRSDTPRLCLALPDHLPVLDEAVELVVYRVSQEALTNVLRHAQARCGGLRLEIKGRALVLTIWDDGVGLYRADGTGHARQADGQGLVGMRERAFAVAASLRIGPRAPAGTEVVLTVPLG